MMSVLRTASQQGVDAIDFLTRLARTHASRGSFAFHLKHQPFGSAFTKLREVASRYPSTLAHRVTACQNAVDDRCPTNLGRLASHSLASTATGSHEHAGSNPWQRREHGSANQPSPAGNGRVQDPVD